MVLPTKSLPHLFACSLNRYCLFVLIVVVFLPEVCCAFTACFAWSRVSLFQIFKKRKYEMEIRPWHPVRMLCLEPSRLSLNLRINAFQFDLHLIGGMVPVLSRGVYV